MKQPTRVDVDANADASLADATANPATGLIGALMQSFNGSTWDRVRSGLTAVTSTLTGWLNVITGVQYNTTPTTRTNGQVGPLEGDNTGNLKVTLATKIAGEDLTYDRMKTEYQGSGVMYTSDQLVKTGAGHLHTLTISCNDSAPLPGTIDVYDNTSAAGTKLFSFAVTATYFVPFSVTLDVTFSTGLYIDFTTTTDVNVTPSWR